jgi:DNA-binding transcriptional ArsR family regulator
MRNSSKAAAKWKGAAPVFAALGHEMRLALVAHLSCGGTVSIARLTLGSALTRQAITKHLHVLAAAGLVRNVRRGRERIWGLNTKQLDEARQYLEVISLRWHTALACLKNLAEE